MCLHCREEALRDRRLASDTSVGGVDAACSSDVYMEGVLCSPVPRSLPQMDFQGQKMAERLMLYIICIAGLVAFCMGWLEGSFALMMKVRITPTMQLLSYLC